ncbi:antibiotic biosynthesis monooxygenase [Gloeocapsa sp. BRSZ]
MSDSTTPFIILAQRQIKSGQLLEFLEVDDELMRDAAKADGFEAIYVLQTLEKPNFVTHFEVWKSQEAHDAYVMDAAHADFENKIKPLVEIARDPQHYTLFRRYDADDRQATSAQFIPKQQPHQERISPLAEEQTKSEVAALLAKLPPLRFFRVAAQAQAVFEPFIQLADALLNQGVLHPRLRELAILAIAHLESADYERVQHEKLASNLGITPHQLQAIRDGDFEAPILNNDERLVLRFVKAWWRTGIVDDATFSATTDRFSSDELVELLLLCGFYQTAARLMTNSGLATESSPDGQFNLSEEN